MLLSRAFKAEPVTPLRQSLRDQMYANEGTLISSYLKILSLDEGTRTEIAKKAAVWIRIVQNAPKPSLNLQGVMQAYPLSSPQGQALMCLSEALLRVPDRSTAKRLIQDKMRDVDWSHLQKSWEKHTLARMASKGLQTANCILHNKTLQLFKSVTDPVIVTAFRSMMKVMGKEFIVGRTIREALKNSRSTEFRRYSYDMLGEGARTWGMAAAYLKSYHDAIESIGALKSQKDLPLWKHDSISVKLSALHPHYNFAHYDQVMERLVPDLLGLCLKAKTHGIALTIDAEETDRLDLSLTVIEKVFASPKLAGWNGLGVVVQAYQKRGLAVIKWLDELAILHGKPLMVRLVKGAYWDTEIKLAQVEGVEGYPVFTRKASTDISYLACAKVLLESKGRLYPQFATHNAYTIAAIKSLALGRDDIEFQRLQGMGEDLYEAVNSTDPTPVRIYAPVGDHHNLLAYLVRRLLENGANSSFVHKIYDQTAPMDDVLCDPFTFFETHTPGAHPNIPLPSHLYGPTRMNSTGYSLADTNALQKLVTQIKAASIPGAITCGGGDTSLVENPATGAPLGSLQMANAQDLDRAIEVARTSQLAWDLQGGSARAALLNRTADLFESHQGVLLKLLISEAGKTLADAISEVREAVDFCRYYAQQAVDHFESPESLKGPTGETNELSLRGRGVFACISPWNFPLAIFVGQVTAALAAGNSVIAKPAAQTPLIAHTAIQLMYEAGIPHDVLHLIPGSGRTIGNHLIGHPHIGGVVFTGSTDTAQHIHQTLASKAAPIVPLIAETGGLNAMIVDASALIEGVVDAVISSAFQSAGQRCSALRMLYVQEDIYAPLVDMLTKAMDALHVGNPEDLSTDVGPVIDAAARDEIEAYVATQNVLKRTSLPADLPGGSYVAPTLIKVNGIQDLEREIFGPILHIASFKANALDQVMDDINGAGYGLTLGLQTRMESVIDQVRAKARVGNIYINRNMIGAVVGVQPFGGEGLSGTGPKAGGPHYVTRFGVERTVSNNITASGGNIDLLNLKE